MMEGAEGGGDIAGLADQFVSAGDQYIVEGDQEEMEEQQGPIDTEPLREQDRFLPIQNIYRIMKKSIPKTGKIAKDAKECVQECVSEFISFITSEASERCHQEKRKTINGEDILFAMSNLGFDNYVEPLKVYLQKYRETLHQPTSKEEKALNVSQDTVDEFSAEDAFPTTLTGNILADQSGQGIIYTTAYGAQINQQTINFG